MSAPHPTSAQLLSTRDAVDLASAWLCQRARVAGIRALLVKGPVAAQLGLRRERVSADADILVEPGRVAEFVDALAPFGWHERPQGTVPQLVAAHSVSLINDDWPIDLDVHAFWPGFLADSGQVFDTLWNSRIHSTLAGAEVTAPSVESMALILALHSLRHPLGRDNSRVDDLAALSAATRRVVPVATGETLLRRARELGATQTAAPFLRMLGVAVAADPAPSRELQLWRLKAETRGNVSAWLLEARRARGIERVRVVLRAVLPGSAELRRLHPDLPPGIRGLVLGWTGRWRSGLRELPRTVSAFRSARVERP